MNTHPNIHYWYHFVSVFSPALVQGWAAKHAPTATKPAPAKNEDDIDLFGDDDAAPVEKPKPKK